MAINNIIYRVNNSVYMPQACVYVCSVCAKGLQIAEKYKRTIVWKNKKIGHLTFQFNSSPKPIYLKLHKSAFPIT